MIKNVQLKRANKILYVDYDLISCIILLFVSIKVCDLGTAYIRYIYIYIYIYIYVLYTYEYTRILY